MPTASWCSVADTSSRVARSRSWWPPTACSPSWRARSSWCRPPRRRLRRSTWRREVEIVPVFPVVPAQAGTQDHRTRQMISGIGHESPPSRERRWNLIASLGLFALASVILAWPWLSGAVTILWDAKSQFFPQVSFLASSLARGESPFWTPNVFAGWPQISDPQSLIFSPLHLLLAFVAPRPGFRAVDGVTFAHLILGGVG